ncbi:MAG TPA: EF-Tu/IF-2/RF-3 family GTPase [Methanoregulaceae archaeon]|nr:EF-Tu/IF-2/RF-3 family GTPase [Methanoregulaceae archaeon]
MSNLNVAMLCPPGYSKEIAKPGTASDITFYNLKSGDVTVTMVEPSRYPEKLAPLFFSVSLAEKVVLVIDEINAQLGEMILMLDCADQKSGFLILRNYITPEQVAPLIKGTAIEGYEVIEDDRMRLRERLLVEAARKTIDPVVQGRTPGAMPIDHFFNVKGIGTVALGCVVGGIIKRHDTLNVLPVKKTALVRSIQKHDDDAEAAYATDRAGLALKGIEAEELDRGYVLTKDPSITSSGTLHGRATLVKYWPSALKEGMVVYVGHWMQFLPSKIAYVNNSGDWHKPEITLKTEKELVYPSGANAILHYLEGGKLRIIGTLAIE